MRLKTFNEIKLEGYNVEVIKRQNLLNFNKSNWVFYEYLFEHISYNELILSFCVYQIIGKFIFSKY